MMITNFGYATLILAFFVSLYAVVAALYGERKNLLAWVESARIAMLLTFPLTTIAVICLLIALMSGDYQVAYVYSSASSTMPFYLKLTALWGGQAGSLLVWSWLMSAFTSAVTLRKWQRDREFLPWVIIVTMVTLLFFLSLTIFIENPFVRYWQVPGQAELTAMFAPQGAIALIPRDGMGMNPMLRHPGMIFHPPMLYLGFVSFVIPYAFAIAALVTGRSDDRWIRITRRWSLVAWLFLSLGLILGSRWAYDVLGWGGYWAWDPVETAAFMPWLTGTAFLHSVMIQEKRGLFKQWNMILIILTYSLVIFGTFLTRSGVLSSVHAFAQSAIGPLFFGFIGISLALSLWLLLKRWGDLRAEGSMTSLLSRESMFLFNNLLFIGILVICFWGVMFPLISELFTGQKVTVGPPFYERSTGPLLAGIMFLMALGPLSAWGRATVKTLGRAIWLPLVLSIAVLAGVLIAGIRSWPALLAFWLIALTIFSTVQDYIRGVGARIKRTGESLLTAFVRLSSGNRRRYGGYIIHLGVALMFIGIIGIEVFQTTTQGMLARGESLRLRGYEITYDTLAVFDTQDGRNVARAVIEVSKNGREVGELYPRREFYYDAMQPMTIPGVRSTLEEDLYVILVDWLPITSQGATFKVYHNPLINWLWIGSIIATLGGLIAAWPGREPELAAVGTTLRKGGV